MKSRSSKSQAPSSKAEFCSQCGNSFLARACGPTHALRANEIRQRKKRSARGRFGATGGYYLRVSIEIGDDKPIERGRPRKRIASRTILPEENLADVTLAFVEEITKRTLADVASYLDNLSTSQPLSHST